ncbi:MAG: hypothetical protein ACOY9Y_06135 [Bacillota bacterium]
MEIDPLAMDGWLEFNRYKWNLEPHKIKLSIDDHEVPAVETVVYLDTRGRIVMPPLNPYLPVIFRPSPTDKVYRLRRQWIAVSELLVAEFQKRRVLGAVTLPTDIVDVRAWQWRGFLAEPRYTFYLSLPLQLPEVDHAFRTKINKATKTGFQVHRSLTFNKVIECLSDTEQRQGFKHGLNIEDLRRASALLGEDSFRCYIAIAPSGEVASARIVLKGPGSKALDWVAGTKRDFLNSGVTQYLIAFVLDDLARDGVKTFDFAGANLPTVQAAKSAWGGDLKVYFVLRAPGLRTIVSTGLRLLRVSFRRGYNEPTHS